MSDRQIVALAIRNKKKADGKPKKAKKVDGYVALVNHIASLYNNGLM